MTELQILKWNKSTPPIIEDIEAMFQARKLNYYSFTNKPGDHYAIHDHTYDKFLAVAQGVTKWIINGQEYILKAGDAVILPKNTKHEVWIIGDEDSECLEGHF